MKVVFLDRDGTIIEDYEDPNCGLIEKPVFLPKAKHRLNRARIKQRPSINLPSSFLAVDSIVEIKLDIFTIKNNQLQKTANEYQEQILNL